MIIDTILKLENTNVNRREEDPANNEDASFEAPVGTSKIDQKMTWKTGGTRKSETTRTQQRMIQATEAPPYPIHPAQRHRNHKPTLSGDTHHDSEPYPSWLGPSM